MYGITAEDLHNEKQRLFKRRKRRRILIPCTIFLVIALCAAAFLHFFTLCTVYGDAMEPQIKSGSLAIVQRTADIREGDVILFTHASLPYVRNVASVSEAGLFVTAVRENALDSESEAMGLISADAVIGRLLFTF